MTARSAAESRAVMHAGRQRDAQPAARPLGEQHQAQDGSTYLHKTVHALA